jgi:hypothetical protein
VVCIKIPSQITYFSNRKLYHHRAPNGLFTR